MRTIRIYELDITYPEGQDGTEYEEVQGLDPQYPSLTFTRASWPAPRRFLDRTAAINRAKNLAALGCTVDVRQSEPIRFEDAPAVHLDPQPSTPPAMECDPETTKES